MKIIHIVPFPMRIFRLLGNKRCDLEYNTTEFGDCLKHDVSEDEGVMAILSFVDSGNL